MQIVLTLNGGLIRWAYLLKDQNPNIYFTIRDEDVETSEEINRKAYVYEIGSSEINIKEFLELCEEFKEIDYESLDSDLKWNTND
jgi:hypothetical protein